MRVFTTTADIKKALQVFQNKTIGFVPTMGALHQGHAKLLQQAKNENDLCVLSIFVNPTQFNNAEDLQKYPKTWNADLKLAEQCGVDFVFAPEFSEMYPDNYRYQVIEKDFSKILCGKDRPGHFEGVLTVVMKLFNLLKPTQAYFGEKDFQQLRLVQEMAKAFFLDVQVVGVPTVRENNGLAMSSRNLRLQEDEKALAPKLYSCLTQSKSAKEAHEHLRDLGFEVDYVEDINGRRFGAAKLGNVRLIDNVEI